MGVAADGSRVGGDARRSHVGTCAPSPDPARTAVLNESNDVVSQTGGGSSLKLGLKLNYAHWVRECRLIVTTAQRWDNVQNLNR